MTTQVQRKVVLKLERSRVQVPRPFTSGVHPTKEKSSFVEFVYAGKDMVDFSFGCNYIAKTTRVKFETPGQQRHALQITFAEAKRARTNTESPSYMLRMTTTYLGITLPRSSQPQ